MEKIHLPLQNYSQAQKLDLLETIWNDISKNEKEFKSPDWHEPILAECRRELGSGESELLDWSDDLKAKIKKDTLC